MKRALWRRVLLAISALGLTKLGVLALGAWVLWPAPRRLPPARRARPAAHYTVRGIDVSHHQGRIDWDAVADSGEVAFVWLKATEGVSHTDRRFARNLEGASEAGLAVGAYHFFSMCRGGAAQAEHFVKTVPREALTLPPAIDVELDGRCNRSASRPARDELAVMVGRLTAHYGEQPLLYVGQWLVLDGWVHATHNLWIPAYDRAPRVDWRFWQYSDRGRIPGIDGPVDLNVFGGTEAELHEGVWRQAGGGSVELSSAY